MILHQVDNSRGNYHYNSYIYDDILWPAHFHGSFELMYVIEGSVDISVNGVTDILQQGELILISPYNIHSLKVIEGKTWVGVFSEDFVTSYAKKHKSTQYSKFKCNTDIEEILKKLLFTLENHDRYLCISLLYMVCNECVKNAHLHNSQQSNEFIHNVITYISENISKDISLKDIASKMNYEYHYFSCLFNQCFSTNFKSFINLLRIEKACALLKESKCTITSVSEACGFASIRNFNRVFKSVCDCTPQEYRKIQGSV
ncbi:MAG: helix-turn-helix transcriptional regulator [Clostridia bacterium]|nr:helix-turn-helix transcriptional regulator [Clostridia bacterium]